MFMPKGVHGNMPHFAKISDSNVVEKVEVFSQEDVDANGGDYSSGVEAWVSSYKGGGTWKQTSYNNNARGEFAGVGWMWEPTKEKFYESKPSGKSSWTLEETGNELTWQPPVDWFNTEDCKLADNSDAKITINTWNESAQTWKGQHHNIEVNGNLTVTHYTWNKSTKVWDRD